MIRNKKKAQSLSKKLLDYNTPLSVLEQEQGVSFGLPSTTKLGDYIKKIGYPSLAEMMKS